MSDTFNLTLVIRLLEISFEKQDPAKPSYVYENSYTGSLFFVIRKAHNTKFENIKYISLL